MNRDIFSQGILAGILGTAVAGVLNYLAVVAGVSKYYVFQLSAGIFLKPGATEQVQGLIFGAAVWIIASGFVGILLAYVFRITGSEVWWLKGPWVVCMVMYIAVYGFLFNLGGAQIVPRDLSSNASFLINNAIYGLVTGYVLSRWNS